MQIDLLTEAQQTAKSLLGNHPNAEDVAQEALISLWIDRDQIPNMKAALSRRIRCKAIDMLRSEKIMRELFCGLLENWSQPEAEP